MSRVYLDGALIRPISPMAQQVHAAALTRAWAGLGAGYHESKTAEGLRSQALTDLSALLGRPVQAWASTSLAFQHALAATAGAIPDCRSVVASAVDRRVVLDAVADCVPHIVAPVRPDGRIDVAALSALPTPMVVVTQVGNQEIATLQPLLEIKKWCEKTGSRLIVDATSAVGWVSDIAGDVIVVEPRVWGSSPGVTLVAGLPDQDAVVEDVPALVTAAATLPAWLRDAADARARILGLTDRLRESVTAGIPDCVVSGPATSRLPHVVSISCLYVDAEALQTRLDAAGYAVGSGSACASRTGQPSHVLAAVGSLTSGNVRLGLSPDTTAEQISAFIETLGEAVAAIRQQMGVQGL